VTKTFSKFGLVSDIFAEMARGRAKHGDESASSPLLTHEERMVILRDEVEEVGDAIDRRDMDGEHGLRAELVQVAAVCIAWLVVLDGDGRG